MRAFRFKYAGCLLLLSGILMCLLLTGCGKETDEVQVVQIWETRDGADSETKSASLSDVDGGKKIGMVTDFGGIDDESFAQGAWEGLKKLEKSTGVAVSYIETQEVSDMPDNFQKMIEDDCSLIWGIGYSCADAVLECAGQNPDLSFAVIDYAYEETPDNVTGVVFRSQEPSFLAGFVAGAVTRTGRLGFIGGVQSEVVDSFRYGFEAGVAYAGDIYGKKIEVTTDYTGSFDDPDKGAELACQMYGSGCDVIFQAAGGSGVGVIETARDKDRFVIGVDRDQSYLAPEQVLTSAMKKVEVATERVSESFLKDEQIGGRTLSLGMTEGAVGLPTLHENYNDEIYDAMLLIADRIKSGQIVPPSTKEEYEQYIRGL